MKLKTIALAVLLAAAVIPAQARKAKKFTHETVAIPAVEARVIAIETANTALLLQVDDRGEVRTVHYGAPVGDPAQFSDFFAGFHHNFGAPNAYPTPSVRLFLGFSLYVLLPLPHLLPISGA